MASPGLPPSSFTIVIDPAAAARGAEQPTACMVDWPYLYPTHPWPFQPPGWHPAPAPPQHYVAPSTVCPLPIAAPTLSDADVERIARRVVELLREARP